MEHSMTADRNDLAYWFPILRSSGAPVPRTEILRTDVDLIRLLDGEIPTGYESFLDALRNITNDFGYPCFLRTGHTSNKHDWVRSCFLERAEDLAEHVVNLVEFSSLADFLDLPTPTWVVREILPLSSTFRAFEDMPVAVEFRTFFRDGKRLCTHPYWPEDSIIGPSKEDWRQRLETQSLVAPEADEQIHAILSQVMPRFEGGWSLDIAMTAGGRMIAIDMAEMERSYHWPGCPNAPAEEDGKREEGALADRIIGRPLDLDDIFLPVPKGDV